MSRQNEPNRHAAPPADTALKPAAQAQCNLLIVEDALIDSSLIARIADEVGFTTETAGRYEDACYLLYVRQFDCITLDLGLGQHVGCEVLYHLAKIRCDAWVIIISGSEKAVCDETTRIGRSLGLNVCEPLPKPIDLKVLRNMLQRIRMQTELKEVAGSVASNDR